MARSGLKGRWWRVLRYIFGGALCVLAVATPWAGAHWYWSVVVFCAGFFIILGERRIFRAGVTRTSDEIVCRYIPWREGNAYLLNVGLPLMAVAMVAAGYVPGNPAWLRFGGIILLVLTPLFTSSAYRMWRLSCLRITPSVLTVGLATPKKGEPTEIPRERIQSITPKIVPNGVGGHWLQVEISYHAADLSCDTKAVLIGLQLSVEPINLLNALVAWKDATDDDSTELLDRIERILRGRATTGG